MELADVQWLALGAGAVALFLGFKFLWLAVAAAGFAGAVQLMPLLDFTAGWTDTTRWVVAAIVGGVLALLTRTLTKTVMRIIGFVLAATFVAPLLRDLEMVSDLGEAGGLVVSVVAGVLGAIVAGIAFKGAIVGLTAGWGATSMLGVGVGTWTESWDPILYLGVFAVLVLAGVLVQYRTT